MSVDQFKLRYPVFSDVSDDTLQLAIDDASSELSARVWGDLYDRGRFALAAHLLKVRGVLKGKQDTGDVPVQVSSKSVGSVSLSYSSASAGFDEASHEGLATTTWGQEYLRMRKLLAQHFRVVR